MTIAANAGLAPPPIALVQGREFHRHGDTGGRTSTFGVSVQALPFSFPEIESLWINNGELTLQGPAETDISFVVEISPTETGPWVDVPMIPIITEGVAEVTLAVGDGSRFYRLTLKI